MVRRLMLLGLAGVVTLGALAFWRWRADRDAGLAMVRDINALSTVHARPTHRPPLGDGSFEACVARQMAALPDAGDYSRFIEPPDGGPTPPLMPPEATADVELRLQPWADRMMECTLRSTVGDATSMTPFEALKVSAVHGKTVRKTSPEFLMMYVPYQAIDVDVKKGRDARALVRCVDYFAFMRDWGPLRGLAIELFGANMKTGVTESCATALSRADEQSRQDFVRQLRVVREGSLPWSELMRRELLVFELRFFGWQLSEASAAELPPLVSLQRVDFDGGEIFSLFSHHDYRVRVAERVRIAALPMEQRAAQRAKLGSTLWVELEIPDSDYLSSEVRHQDAERSLDLLESAGRVLLGDPPLPSVTAEPFDGGTRLVATFNASDGGVGTRELKISSQVSPRVAP